MDEKRQAAEARPTEVSSDDDVDRPARSLTWRTLARIASIGIVIALGSVIVKVIADPDRAAERLTIVGGMIAVSAVLLVLSRIVFHLVLATTRRRVGRKAGTGAVVLQIPSSEGMSNAILRIFGSRRPDELLRAWQVNPVLVADLSGIAFWNAGELEFRSDGTSSNVLTWESRRSLADDVRA